MNEDRPAPPAIDSRRWTGRGLGPTAADRHAAWQAFRSAAGPQAIRPRRAAAIVCGVGGLLVPLAVAAGSPAQLPPLASHLRTAAQAAFGPDTAARVLHWLAVFAGPALAIGLLASLAGMASAWRNRHALARGFATVTANRLEQGGADIGLTLAAMVLVVEHDPRPSLFAILSFWMMAYFLARGMTLMAERLVAAPGERTGMAVRTGIAMTVLAALLISSAQQ